ncbi:hypothetical protein IAR55_005458 [Kwoniella newhampshirensis]|uniref:Uncharacterized protein n=1 Tax=Kwoniella newhampshirensis TaxID=1651941 RepID=A0AAW0YMA2_9TREE
MGGNAFDTPALRLSQDRYGTLRQYVLSNLASLKVFEGIDTPRNLKDKVDHGDLDVLCGWSGAEDIGGGDEEWVMTSVSDQNEVGSSKMGTRSDGGSAMSGGDDLVTDHLVSKQTSEAEICLHDKKDQVNTIISRLDEGTVRVLGKGKMAEGPGVDRARELCDLIRRKLGAHGWRRRGVEASFKVSPGVLSAGGSDEGGVADCRAAGLGDDEFYQVDILFVPPYSFHFIHFTSAYSSTALLIGRIIRTLSPCLTLHLTQLAIRHSPFFGLKPIDVTLTTSPEALCAWLGLDWERWSSEGDGWKDERQFWDWVTTPHKFQHPDDSNVGESSGLEAEGESETLVERALRRMARKQRQKKGDQTNSRGKRNHTVDQFFDWLRTDSKWAEVDDTPSESIASTIPTPVREDGVVVKAAEIATRIEDLAITPDTSTLGDHTASEKSVISSSTPNPIQASSTSALSILAQSTSSGSTSTTTDNPAFLDPENPFPLDSLADAALDSWGKRAEYDRILEERREVARDVAERQVRRAARRVEESESRQEQLTVLG